MKADARFLGLPNHFWANVRTISQEVGYTEKGTKSIKIPTLEIIQKKFDALGLKTTHIVETTGKMTDFGQLLISYFEYRANILNNKIRHYLMNKEEAESLFESIKYNLNPKCPMPKNKQKGEKQNFAFFTCIVNMLIEENIGNSPCNYDPKSLTTLTHDGMPFRTLSRRVDGAFPSVINPIAIWEIKEYYYTTTFGSRVADGVYETLLDGMELESARGDSHPGIQHVLFIDDYFTWWDCGRSYLCRIIDMLHMGYVGEVVFGKEVLSRLPLMAREWKEIYQNA